MPSKAIVVVTGHCGRSPELQYLQSGVAVARFSVATNAYQGRDKDDATTWWNISVFGQQAEYVNSFLSKGGLVQVTGEAYQEEWTGKDGETRQSMKVKASDVLLLSRREDAGAPDDSGPSEVPF